MRPALHYLRYWPDAAFLRRGAVYALSFLTLAGTAWLTGDTGYIWSATASIWTCLADRPGTAAARVRGLATVGIGGAAVSVIGASLHASPLAALAFVLAAGLMAGLSEVRGPATALWFKLLYVVLIAACLQPASGPSASAHAWMAGLDFLRGGLFACAVSLVLIPSDRETRPRTEIIAIYDALRRFAVALAEAGSLDMTPHKQEIRLCIETARRALASRRGLADPVALVHYVYAIAVGDAIFALLIVAGELRERLGVDHALPLACAASRLTDMHAQVLQALSCHGPDLPALTAMLFRDLREMAARRTHASTPPAYQSALAALAQFPAFDRWREGFSWPISGFAGLIDRLGLMLADLAARDTRVTRHAVRLALAGGLSLLPAQIWHVDHGYWVAVTVIMVLSPRLQTTRQISFLRFAGSLAGALFACAISLLHPTPAPVLGLSALFLAGAYAARLAGNPGGFAFCLTPAVILFSWLGEPTSSSSQVAAMRGLDTAIGCLIALASYYILAPRAELSRVFRHSIDALAVNAVYLRAASRASRTLTPSHLRLEALRVAAGRASSRAEATLSQSAGDLASDLTAAHTSLHDTARRMASLAGLIRASAESGSVDQHPGPAVQALLSALEVRLAEAAARPGRIDAIAPSAPDWIGPSPLATTAFEQFLVEQAAYANAHVDSAHQAVARMSALAAAHEHGGRSRRGSLRAS